MNSAGISAESLRMRLSAGWRRSCIASKSRRPVAADHDLAVERGVGRQQIAERAQLGEVAQQRPAVAAPERELAAVVLEHAAEAVPLRLVLPTVRPEGAPRPARPPSAGTGSGCGAGTSGPGTKCKGSRRVRSGRRVGRRANRWRAAASGWRYQGGSRGERGDEGRGHRRRAVRRSRLGAAVPSACFPASSTSSSPTGTASAAGRRSAATSSEPLC